MGAWSFVGVTSSALLLLVGCSAGGESGADPIADITTAEKLADEVAGFFTLDLDFAQQLQAEIARCMREQGFEYVPYIDPNLYGGAIEPSPSPSPSIDRFERAVRRVEHSDNPDNPNEVIYTELVAAGNDLAITYSETLWGAGEGLNVERPEEVPDLSLDALGCWNYSAVQLTGGRTQLEREYAIGELNMELRSRVESDPRYVAKSRAVDRCVAENDGSFLEASFEAEFRRLAGLDLEAANPVEVDLAFDRAKRAEAALTSVVAECEPSHSIDELAQELAAEHFDDARVALAG